MTKEYLKFESLDADDQEWHLKETWCNNCGKPDIGMKEPVMYKENGKTFIEGKCLACGEAVISSVTYTKISK